VTTGCWKAISDAPPPSVGTATDACTTLDELAHEYFERVVSSTRLPARLGCPATTAAPLAPVIVERLRRRGIDQLWGHQATAIDALRERRNVVVATGTASGKSLCYQIPIVESLAAGSRDTALLIYPTKALAQDQLRALRQWLVPEVVAATYDGDTGVDERTWTRAHANVLLTNPEMLHMGILPSHARWATFLMRLQFVVIDELHTLRGVFGSHVAHVLRRLRRLCAHYGSDPVFCFTSATIGNPVELASQLCGLPVEAIDVDGSPQAERSFAVWQRPLLDEHSGTRASANLETSMLLARFVDDGHQTLAFTRSRKGAELVAAQARRALAESRAGASGAPPEVAAYRAGYLASERRELEDRLASGELGGVVGTSALELGIDVGSLDAVVLNGFPGTLSSMRQQVGRAGRTSRRAAAVLVAGDDQLDQWYVRHPAELLSRSAEAAVVNPDNPFVARAQLSCAAHEMPLRHEDDHYFGDALDDAVRDLVLADLLKPRGDRMYWAGREPPAPKVGLRTGSSLEFQLVDGDGRLVGTVDAARAFHVAHPGAMYLHQGRQYRVESLDVDNHVAVLEPADDADEHTQPREETDISILDTERTVAVGSGHAHLGSVAVMHHLVAYQRRRTSTNEVLEVVPLDYPPRELTTRACWYTVTPEALLGVAVDPSRVIGAVHAAEHALIGLLPLFAICDRWDVGGVSMAIHPQTGVPTIFVYDGYPGGAGIAELAFAELTRHIAAAHELVDECPCDDGCPSCVQSPKCGNWNEYLDKRAAVALLETLGAPASHRGLARPA
jgi:DEAD/DEAH box helicase domain-containing protein